MRHLVYFDCTFFEHLHTHTHTSIREEEEEEEEEKASQRDM
jgi:hypothetical protein